MKDVTLITSSECSFPQIRCGFGHGRTSTVHTLPRAFQLAGQVTGEVGDAVVWQEGWVTAHSEPICGPSGRLSHVLARQRRPIPVKMGP